MQSSLVVAVQEAHRPQAVAVAVERAVTLLVGLIFQIQ
jgi:hypothetical protein